MGPPGEQARSPRHSVVYFSRPNSHIKLQSLLDEPDPQEEVLTIDEWIAKRVKLRRTPNYKDASTYHASRGTEHTKGSDGSNPLLGKGPEEVKAV
jgi:hypothetical protein